MSYKLRTLENARCLEIALEFAVPELAKECQFLGTLIIKILGYWPSDGEAILFHGVLIRATGQVIGGLAVFSLVQLNSAQGDDSKFA